MATGRTDPEDLPERRCILTGESGPRDRMIRLVRDPEGTLVPDIAERLPGRGCWISSDRARLEEALAKKRLAAEASRGLKTRVRPEDVPADLAARIERLLLRRVEDRLGLEQRAGRLNAGFERARLALMGGRVRLLLEAADGTPDGRRKLRALAGPETAVVALLTRAQMSLALGRENVVHAAVENGGGAETLLRELTRLAAWWRRPLAEPLERRASPESDDETLGPQAG